MDGGLARPPQPNPLPSGALASIVRPDNRQSSRGLDKKLQVIAKRALEFCHGVSARA